MAKFRLNKITFRTFMVIAIPLALQNLVTTAVSLVDNLMIGTLGNEAIASVNLANQFFFVFNLMIFGMGSGSAVLLSQYWGKKDHSSMRTVTGITFVLAMLISCLFGLAAFCFPKQIMGIFSIDNNVIELGAKYIKIMAVTYPLTAATMVLSYLLKSSEEVKVPLWGSFLSIGINIVFNYILIYGNFGAPAMGVEGAAYATLIARVFECSFVYIASFIKIDFVRKNLRDYVAFPKDVIKKFLVTSCPVVLNETLWSVGISMYFTVYSRIGVDAAEGTAAVTAVNIASLAEKLSSVFIFGMSHAVCIIIGKEIGSKRIWKAKHSAGQFSVLAPMCGVIFGTVMIAAMPLFISLFNVTPRAEEYARNLIIILAVALSIKNLNLVSIVGIFRGGGDTVFSCVLDVLGVWAVGLPAAIITGYVFHWPLEAVFASTLIEEFIKVFVVSFRIKSGKWIHYLV